jgi:type IV pilus assembly protein PilM
VIPGRLPAARPTQPLAPRRPPLAKSEFGAAHQEYLMAGPQTIWGLDVGKCALKALKLRIGADKSVEVVAADYIEHAKILTAQEPDRDQLFQQALEKFLSRNDITNDKVVVGVSGQQTLARFSKLPPVEKKKIPDIVRYEADQQIPFDMDEVVWDYQVFNAPDSPEVEVGIFAIKRELIRGHLLHFETAGIAPYAVQSAPLALYNGMQHDGWIEDQTVVLVDIGTENTDLLVATKDHLWTRTINVGGNNFTEALVKNFKLNFSKAETLKRTAATSKYARQIFQAMRPVFADLVQELQRSLGFFTATHRDADLSKMIGLGAAFKLPGLQKYIQQNLQLDFTKIDQFNKIRIPATNEAAAESASSFVVAYGLALQGLGIAKVTSNLLPPEIAKQIIWKKKRPFFAAAAACLLLAAGVIWFRNFTDSGTLAANRGQEHVSVSSLEEAKRIMENPPNAPPREYGQRMQAVATLFKNQYGQLSSQGEMESGKINSVIGIYQDRAKLLKIIAAVHEALPKQEGALGEAATASAYMAAMKDAPKRGERNQVFIDRFDQEYLANLDEQQLADEWVRNRIAPITIEGGEARPGFRLTLHCRTPNGNKGIFVRDSFLKNLAETGRRPKQGFYISRVGMIASAETGPRGGASTGGGWGDKTGTTGTAPVDTNLDPLTREPIKDDWVFTIQCDVVLKDLPEPPPAEGQPGQPGQP